MGRLTVSATEMVSFRDESSWVTSRRIGRIDEGGNSDTMVKTKYLSWQK